MGTEGIHTPEWRPRETPTPCDLASEHLGRIQAGLTAAGHPCCDLGCGTLREEGTSVGRVGSWSVQRGCQGSGGAKMRTILPDTRANRDPTMRSVLHPGQTGGRTAGV